MYKSMLKNRLLIWTTNQVALGFGFTVHFTYFWISLPFLNIGFGKNEFIVGEENED